MFRMRSLCVLLSSVCGAALAPYAHAESAASAALGATSTSLIEEVVVTAQRREEKLRDVPLSIAVKSADDLEKSGIRNLTDLTTVIPGVRIDNAGAYVQPAIRGISALVIGPATSAPVAVYIDGVYNPNQLATKSASTPMRFKPTFIFASIPIRSRLNWPESRTIVSSRSFNSR